MCITWNATILVVVLVKEWIQGGVNLGCGGASPLTKSSFRPNALMVTSTYWHIADSTCIHWNPAILVVFFRTELFAYGYQASDESPFGLL